MIVELPWPPKELTPNFKRRKHWSFSLKPTKQYRQTCCALALVAGARKTGDKFGMMIAFFPPDRRKRDDDGMIGAFKAGRDGLADAIGVDDHVFRPTYSFGDPVKGGKVVVTIII